MPGSKRIFGLLAAGAFGATIALLITSLSSTQFPSIQGAGRTPVRPSPHTSHLDESAPDLTVTPFAANDDREPDRARIEVDLDTTATAFLTPLVATATATATQPTRRDRSSVQTDPHSARLDDQSGADDEPARPIDWCSFKTHDNHDFLSDTSTVWNGSRSVWIGRAENAAREPYFSVDALWQSVDATPYRGTRIELSAHVKGRGYFQLFLRAARSADRAIVLTHNQSPNVPTTNRYVSLFPPNGDDWTRLSIVGEIPAGVDVIYYGVSLMNGNAIWIDDVRLSPAEPQMPLTNVQSHGGHVELPVHVTAMLSAPSNLDFEVATGSASPRDSACRVSLGRSE